MPSSSSETIVLKTIAFDSLSVRELHDVLKLRVDIFVVEQNCAYHEIDGKDPLCYHCLGINPAGEVVAAARIAPEGVIYPQVSIGRVVVRDDCRGLGIGHALMHHCMEHCKAELVAKAIKIAAQHYLEKFYESLGFKTISAIYPWDGIDHVDMLWQSPDGAIGGK